MPYFKYKDKQCYYETHGEGSPLLLLHGNTASSKMFAKEIAFYKEEFMVILIDFLGHGKSDRLLELPQDLWYDEALQVISFMEEMKLNNVNIIGTSGGALVAINVGLMRGNLVHKIIADSFEGEYSIIDESIIEERKQSKLDQDSIAFYEAMHGDDWKQIVDQDTMAIYHHSISIKQFFHQPLQDLHNEILLTGSKEDEYVALLSPTYFEDTYQAMLKKIPNGTMYLFPHGHHPAMSSNKEEFAKLAASFFKD